MMKPRDDYPLDRSEMAEPTTADIYAEMTTLLDVRAALDSPMPELPETMGDPIDMGEVGAFLRSMRASGASAEQAIQALGEAARGMRVVMVDGTDGGASLRQALGRPDRSAGHLSINDVDLGPVDGSELVFFSTPREADDTPPLRFDRATYEIANIGGMDDVFKRLIDVAESEPGREIRRAAENMREHLDARAVSDDGLTSRQARRAANRRKGTTRWGRR